MWPSTGPLSKSLLHYHILGLYRRIEINTRSKMRQLVEKILSDPFLGPLVQVIEFDPYDDETFDAIEDEDKFFKAMPNLRYLDLGTEYSYLFPYASGGCVYESLTSLTFLRIGGNGPPSQFLYVFPALETLYLVKKHPDEADVLDFSIEDNDYFPNLTDLSLEGEICSEPEEVANFLSKLPNLSDLTLEFRYGIRDIPNVWPRLAELLSPTLEWLDLSHWDGARPIDHFLPRFTQLKRLSLSKGFFSENIPSYLTQSHALEELHLDHGKVSFTQFCTLLSDRQQLPRLETLSLDVIDKGKRGESILGEDGLPRSDWIIAEGDLIRNGWELPGFDEQGGFTFEGAKELLKLAEDVEVEIRGDLKEAVSVEEDYRTEVGNVAAYRTFQDKDFRHIHNVRNRFPHWSGWLFDLDLESLDPSKLVLQIYSGGIHGSKPSYRIAGAG
ncbi:hypothetical protein JCM5350_007193 [Sporobolomyces pararoseus]